MEVEISTPICNQFFRQPQVRWLNIHVLNGLLPQLHLAIKYSIARNNWIRYRGVKTVLKCFPLKSAALDEWTIRTIMIRGRQKVVPN